MSEQPTGPVPVPHIDTELQPPTPTVPPTQAPQEDTDE